MADPQFVHLRMHSEYSIVDGTVRIADVIEAAKNDRQGALALTDFGNLFGAIKFYRAAWNAGIKPLIGCDVVVCHRMSSSDSGEGVKGRCLLLTRNLQGYLNLCNLLSRAYLNNNQRGINEIEFSWFSEFAENIAHEEDATENFKIQGKILDGKGVLLCNGLILLSGAHYGAVGQSILNNRPTLAKEIAEQYKNVFHEDFYLEIQRSALKNIYEANNSCQLGDTPSFTKNEWLIAETINLAKEIGSPIVATHPIQFMEPDDFAAHEARVCIATSEKLGNAKRKKNFNEEQYFRKQSEMMSLFADLPKALENSIQIAKRCNLRLPFGKMHLPVFPTPKNQAIEDFFLNEAHLGLEKRLIQLFPNIEEREKKALIYYQRLDYEVGVINQMGFAGYFLIVADFIAWSVRNDVPVGPGRGSGAGSLVAFALGITSLDPLRYNLLFERFLNPERVSMPDFDIDFCQHGRDLVIGYVKQKYGKDSVSQIATFGTMAAKASVRDVGRVLDLGYGFTDSIARLIPFKPGRQVTIQSALDDEPILLERYQNDEEVKNLLDLAKRVEGLTRNVGMHAGGVLIAAGPLTRYCPLYKQDEETGVISQYDKDDVEAIGLVKFDFLGLTTLTILHWTERFIRKNYPEHLNWTKDKITLDNEAVFKLLKSGKTVAVFQLESRGMQGMLKDAQPDRFEDIIALVALFRPGPMDLIPSFCARKQGREQVTYPDPRVADILSETYGIMVYQEQVMQMAQIIGGYSLGGADLLRRAMGKKKPEEMAEHRTLFRKGAISQGLTKQKADEIFDLMEKFAGYGFNKSHAAAYALLAYYTAWMKVHYPAEFMSANLSLALDDSDKLKILIDESKALGIRILPPDINQSGYYFLPEPPGEDGRSDAIRFGLGAIKGTGKNAIAAIEGKRNEKLFVDIFDFCSRFEGIVVNKRALESLIKAGAFDALEKNRAALLTSLPLAFEVAEQSKLHKEQDSLFEGEETNFAPKLVNVITWSKQICLQEEKSVLGFYFSGHLFDGYFEEVRQFPSFIRIAELKPAKDVMVVGVIRQLRTQLTARGKLVIVTMDDGSAQCDIVVFNELYDQNRSLFQEDNLLIAFGQVREDTFSGGVRLMAVEVMNLMQGRIRFAKMIRINIHQATNIEKLRALLLPYKLDSMGGVVQNKPASNQKTKFLMKHLTDKKEGKNGLSLEFFYQHEKASVVVKAGPGWLISPEPKLFSDIESNMKNTKAEIIYR